jgi:hypothetical protein
MSTRSVLAIKEGKRYKYIYVHSDGHPEYMWETLKEHYDTKEKAEELVNLGDLSFVGKEIGKKHKFEDSYSEHPNWTVAYGRDRGETGIEPREHKMSVKQLNLRAERLNAEYFYVFNKGKWEGYKVGNSEPLKEKRIKV